MKFEIEVTASDILRKEFNSFKEMKKWIHGRVLNGRISLVALLPIGEVEVAFGDQDRILKDIDLAEEEGFFGLQDMTLSR